MSYLGQQLGQGQAERFVFTASGGETSVTTSDDERAIAYTVGQVDVYLNGAKLINGSDFTATTGTSITGLAALTASDVVEVFALSIFQASDTVSAASGGTFNGNVTVDANLSVTGTVDINGGSIDGTIIGAATPAAGSFTTGSFTGTVDASSQVLVGTNDSVFAENNLRFKPSGAAYIDHNTVGQSINFRLSNASSLDVTPLVLTSAGNVGIGTGSPSGNLHVDGGEVFFTATGDSKLQIKAGNTSSSFIEFGDPDDGNVGRLLYGHSDNSMQFTVNASERMRITSAGNVGIGINSPARQLHVKDSSTYGYARVEGASGGYGGVLELVSNSLGSGTDFAGVVDFYMTTSNHIGRIKVQRQSGAADNGDMLFYTATGGSIAEKARIDSSGNLLVGTTTANPTSIANNTPGVELSNTGGLRSSVDNDPAATLNRKTAEGILVLLRVDGGTKGSIGVKGSRPFLSNNINFSIKIDDFANGSLLPADEDGTTSDNVSDIGSASTRWDDIYATNGTINTSDRNEKQDIEELSEAERRVAVAAKGLLRKFRWISSVEEKGDDARIHFGIIAQDLQAAFEAEGLDAGRYAMFIHSTWTDEETGEERSRMGVRYSELLAFIIAAL